jgi:hypothetical protein
MLTEPGMKAKMDNSQGTSDKDGLQTEAWITFQFQWCTVLCTKTVVRIPSILQVVLYLLWCLNMWGNLKFVYEALNWIALNHSIQSQTKTCITKSCEICALEIYSAVVIPYWHFRTTYQSHFQYSRNPRTKQRTEVH